MASNASRGASALPVPPFPPAGAGGSYFRFRVSVSAMRFTKSSNEKQQRFQHPFVLDVHHYYHLNRFCDYPKVLWGGVGRFEQTTTPPPVVGGCLFRKRGCLRQDSSWCPLLVKEVGFQHSKSFRGASRLVANFDFACWWSVLLWLLFAMNFQQSDP